MALPALLVGLIPDLVKKAVDLFDKKYQSDAEKEAAIRDFQMAAETRVREAWNFEQEQITLRHANDMSSDSWLSKNIRPLVLVYLMGLFTTAFFMAVPAPVLEMLQSLLMTVFVFYFGARGLEKIVSIIRK